MDALTCHQTNLLDEIHIISIIVYKNDSFDRPDIYKGWEALELSSKTYLICGWYTKAVMCLRGYMIIVGDTMPFKGTYTYKESFVIPEHLR